MDDPEDKADAAFARLRALMAGRADAAELVGAMAAVARHLPHKRRGMQADLIARAFRDAAEIAAACGWDGRVVVSQGMVMVEQDGALFRTDLSNRYFRDRGPPAAWFLLRRLERLGLTPQVVFDVGANIGDIAIYLARACPQAQVFAFEPAPENIEGFRANLALQTPPLENLRLIAEAVGDRRGSVPMIVGAGLLNTTLVEENAERLAAVPGAGVIEVPTDTLEGFAGRLDAPVIDFLKLDMEGGEPRLAASVRAMAGRIRSAYVEMSRFNTLDAYLDLADAFAAAGLVMADKKLARIEAPGRWLPERLAEVGIVNVWFVDRAGTVA